MRQWLEYAVAWTALKILGLLPRPAARAAGAWVASVVFQLRPVLRRTAEFNLGLAFPQWTARERRETIRRFVRHMGWMAGEFSQFPRYTPKGIERVVMLEGLGNFDAAERRGKGVLFLTGHMGAWELAPFAHNIAAAV